jgi:hypothetical protein
LIQQQVIKLAAVAASEDDAVLIADSDVTWRRTRVAGPIIGPTDQ